MRKWFAHKLIARFERHYHYDASYLHALLDASPAAFFKFAPFQKLGAHREAAPVEAIYAAKLVGAMTEDCGPCVQICIDMARAARVADSDIDAVLRRDINGMSENAAIGFLFADRVARREDADAIREEVRSKWGDKGVVDLAFAVQIGRLPPMVKAGLGYAQECSRVKVGDHPVAVAKSA